MRKNYLLVILSFIILSGFAQNNKIYTSYKVNSSFTSQVYNSSNSSLSKFIFVDTYYNLNYFEKQNLSNFREHQFSLFVNNKSDHKLPFLVTSYNYSKSNRLYNFKNLKVDLSCDSTIKFNSLMKNPQSFNISNHLNSNNFRTLATNVNPNICLNLFKTLTNDSIPLFKKDTILICKSDLGRLRLTDLCFNSITSIKWIYKKNRIANDSIITSLVSGAISVNTPGLYICEVTDSSSIYKTIVRDSLWILTRRKPILSTLPIIAANNKRYCLNQELKFKLVSNIPLIGNSKYTMLSTSNPNLFSTAQQNNTGDFTIVLDKSKLITATSPPILQVKLKFEIIDSLSCVYDTTQTIQVVNFMGILPIRDTVLCSGDSLRARATNKVANFATYIKNFKYTWTPSILVSGVTQPSDTNIFSRVKILVASNTVFKIKQELINTTINPNGCMDSVNFTVSVKPSPLLSVSPDTSFCGGSIANVTLKASVVPPANYGPYKYKWINLSNISDSTISDTKIVSPSVTTKYKVEVIGVGTCKASHISTIGIGVPPVANKLLPRGNDTTICTNASITLNSYGTGGTPYKFEQYKYKYEWRDLATNTTLYTDSVWNYKVLNNKNIGLVVIDANGCKGQLSIPIKSSFKLQRSINDTTICNGTSFVPISTQPIGSISYKFLWNQSPPLVSNSTAEKPRIYPTDTLTATQYILKVTDPNLCSVYDTFMVNVSSLPKLILPISPLELCLNSKVILKTNPINGKSPYVFNWTEPANQNLGFKRSDSSAIELVPIKIGNGKQISVKVRDANRCESKTYVTQINVNETPKLFLGNDTILCASNSISKDVYDTYNSTLNVSYKWFLNGNILNNYTSQQIINNGGFYKAIVTSANGCSIEDSVFIDKKDTINKVTLEPDTSICKGSVVNFKILVQNGNPDFIVKWSSSGLGIFESPHDSVLKTFVDRIKYISKKNDLDTITVKVFVQGACNVKADSIKLILKNAPTAIIQSISPKNGLLNQEITFDESSIYNKSLIWDFGDGTLDSSKLVSIQHAYSQSGKKTITLKATNTNGCIDQVMDSIFISNNQNIYLPSILSLSSAQVENKVIKVYGSNVASSDFLFTIFNKWGEKIFETNSLTEATSQGWNGKEYNTGAEMPQGVYTYTLKAHFEDNMGINKSGSITLIK